VIALAARMMGLVINPIPPIYRESELAYILADCGSKLIFVPGTSANATTARWSKASRQMPALKNVIVVRDDGPLRWEDVVAGEPLDADALPDIDPGRVIIAMYTSGTTGRPKCVLHTHFTYGHRVKAMADAYLMSEADVTFMPRRDPHHRRDLGFRHAWVAGNTSVLMDVWSPVEGIACIEEHGCTVSGGATPFSSRCWTLPRKRPSGCVQCDCSSAAVRPFRPNSSSAPPPWCPTRSSTAPTVRPSA